jgi:hypothetical protein
MCSRARPQRSLLPKLQQRTEQSSAVAACRARGTAGVAMSSAAASAATCMRAPVTAAGVISESCGCSNEESRAGTSGAAAASTQLRQGRAQGPAEDDAHVPPPPQQEEARALASSTHLGPGRRLEGGDQESPVAGGPVLGIKGRHLQLAAHACGSSTGSGGGNSSSSKRAS